MGRRRADQAIAMRTIMRNDRGAARLESRKDLALGVGDRGFVGEERRVRGRDRRDDGDVRAHEPGQRGKLAGMVHPHLEHAEPRLTRHPRERSEEHTSELQSLMRISYAVFCLKKTKERRNKTNT